MRLVWLCMTLLSATIVGIGYTEGYFSNSVPVTPEEPEQLRHVVYFWVCDSLVGVLVPGDPWYFASAEQKASDEMIDIMVEAEFNNRYYNVEHVHRDCFSIET